MSDMLGGLTVRAQRAGQQLAWRRRLRITTRPALLWMTWLGLAVGCVEIGQSPPNLGPLPDPPGEIDSAAPIDSGSPDQRAPDDGVMDPDVADVAAVDDQGAADRGVDAGASDSTADVRLLEACNGVDDDGDGATDEGVGGDEVCTTGEPGRCSPGRLECFGGQWTCIADESPTDETCNGADDDCDGQTDEGDDAGRLARDCYAGPDGTAGVGACRAGRALCVDGAWWPCEGEVRPVAEVCDARDEDCNGRIDDLAGGEVCACQAGETRPCYSGPAGTEGIGPCRGGMQRCREDGRAWLPCEGEVLPAVEVCNEVDDDCDRTADDGVLNACGQCGAPPAEICDGLDNDCDRAIDEGVPDCSPIMRCEAFVFTGRNDVASPMPEQVGGGDQVLIMMVESYRPRGAQRYGFTLFPLQQLGCFHDQAGEGSEISGRVCWLATGSLGRGVWELTAGEPVVLQRPELADARSELIAPLWMQYVYRQGGDFLWFTAEGRAGDPGEVRIDGRGEGGLNALGIYLRFGPSIETTRCSAEANAGAGAARCELNPPAPNYRATLIRPITSIVRAQTPEEPNAMWWSTNCDENNDDGWTCTAEAGGTNDPSARVRADFHMIWKQTAVD